MTRTREARTRHPIDRIALLMLVLFSAVFALPGQPTNVSILPPSDWVRMVEWSTSIPRTTNEKAEGTHYLLYERQQHAQLREQFERNILLMRNETGVQDSGSLSFNFDPSYQQLILHRVQIHRDARTLDRLDKTKIKIIQPESELGGHLFTGRQTAVLFVQDLRVGDVLEYAFTTQGANPILGDHFSTRLLVQSGVPVDRQRMRVVWSSAKPLHMRQHLTEAVPTKTARNGGAEYLWDFTNLTAVAYEDFTPLSFEAYPYVELSDFDNWARVVEWALPLYNVTDTNLPADLQKLIEQWQHSASSHDEKARLALQFVQDDLRYTGLELGPDSYRPTPPAETFEKRFGDCKGKAFLLCAILRAMKFEAWPALVNASVHEAITQRLPSPFAFNHVIVKLNLAGQTIWLDPTISHQGGQLRNRSMSRLGKALVIQPGVTALEDIPPPRAENALQRVTSTFKITDYESPIALTVKTTYHGFGADDMREQFARTDAKDTLKDYLNFYARYYPGIGDAQPLEVSDDRARNILTVTEHYQIKDLWKADESSNKWQAVFYADSLLNALADPTTRLRKRPLRLSFPFRREHEILVHLPEKGWQIPDAHNEVDHPAFSFRYQRKLSGSTVRFHYECETKTAEVPVDQVASYLKKREEMEDLLGDTLERPNASRTILAQLNWLMVVVAGFGFCAVLISCVWVWRVSRLPVDPPPPLPEMPKLQGLGGWLILVGIGLCIAPVVRVVHLGQNWEGFFSIDVWQSVAVPKGEQYHSLYAPLLIFEVLGNVALLGLSVLTLCLFFAKRTLFPKAFIALMVANAIFLCVDELVGNRIPWVAAQPDASSRRELFRATTQAVIWSAYMLKSKRVRATFVR